MAIVCTTRVFAVDVEQVSLADGRTHEMATIRHAPCVVLIPVLDDGRVILIRQYRHSVKRVLWEFPAGSIDPGEAPEAAAMRECEEETRLAPGRVERLASMFPAPGYCDEEMIYFKATGLHAPAPDSTHAPDDDEDISVHPTTVAEARAMLARGDIVDLKTAYALSLI
ncbi:MAG TPA: NUDIX hydrolase [Vicinamibacterales bacterium]|nr:NUDIX hydrolase [Vicinamibacterales bacterium]